jgi:hypothetical protein
VFTICWVIAAAACSSPTGPGVSVAAAQPTSPSNGSSFSYYSQPVTLVVTTGVATGGATSTNTLEVATDAAFATLVTTQTVAAGATGQVTLTLDHLSPATTYYWRVKTAAGNNPGLYSSPARFSIGPQLVIQAPVPIQPLADTFPHKRPTFTVTNVARTGPPASITYRFDVATDAAFNNLVATGIVPEAATLTSFIPSVDLTSGVTYFWRAQASDTMKGVTSAYSSAQAFTTVFPEAGTYRYTLVVRSPSWCLTHYVNNTPCWDNGWTTAGFSYDGPLAVNDAGTLRFTLLRAHYDFSGPLVVELQRTGRLLVGSISGTADGLETLTANKTQVASVIYSRGVISGQTDNQGNFQGTFDGAMGLWKLGFPCDSLTACSTTGFTWTLTPH